MFLVPNLGISLCLVRGRRIKSPLLNKKPTTSSRQQWWKWIVTEFVLRLSIFIPYVEVVLWSKICLIDMFIVSWYSPTFSTFESLLAVEFVVILVKLVICVMSTFLMHMKCYAYEQTLVMLLLRNIFDLLPCPLEQQQVLNFLWF